MASSTSFTFKGEHAGIGYDVRYRKCYFDLERKPRLEDPSMRISDRRDSIPSILRSGHGVETRVSISGANSMEMLDRLGPPESAFEHKKSGLQGRHVARRSTSFFCAKERSRQSCFNGVYKTISLSLTEDKYKIVITQASSIHDYCAVIPCDTTSYLARDDAPERGQRSPCRSKALCTSHRR